MCSFRYRLIQGFTLDRFPALMLRTSWFTGSVLATVGGKEANCSLTLVQSLLSNWVMHTPLQLGQICAQASVPPWSQVWRQHPWDLPGRYMAS